MDDREFEARWRLVKWFKQLDPEADRVLARYSTLRKTLMSMADALEQAELEEAAK
jgi:hypothetical protein